MVLDLDEEHKAEKEQAKKYSKGGKFLVSLFAFNTHTSSLDPWL